MSTEIAVSYAPRVPGLPRLDRQAGLMPEFVGNTIETVNSLSRIVLKTSLAAERFVDGTDELVTLMLRQQRERLLAELQPA